MSWLLAMRWQSASPLIRWAVAGAVVAYHAHDGTVKLHLASSFVRVEEAASLAALGRECHWLWEHPEDHASCWSKGGCELEKLETWLRCQVACKVGMLLFNCNRLYHNTHSFQGTGCSQGANGTEKLHRITAYPAMFMQLCVILHLAGHEYV